MLSVAQTGRKPASTFLQMKQRASVEGIAQPTGSTKGQGGTARKKLPAPRRASRRRQCGTGIVKLQAMVAKAKEARAKSWVQSSVLQNQPRPPINQQPNKKPKTVTTTILHQK